MSDSYKGLTVTFEREVSEEQIRVVTQAILLMRGVASVGWSVDRSQDYMNREMVKHELRMKLFEVLK